MKKLLIAAAAMSMLFSCGTAPAYAQQVACGPTEEVYTVLKDEFKEQVFMQGMSNTGALLETFLNSTTGTWSVILTDPNAGTSCLAASGDKLKLIKPIVGAAA